MDKHLYQSKLLDLKKKISKNKILSCLIMKDEKPIFEYYKNNKEENKLQTINSCTKSIMSALIGIAIDHGFIESISIPISTYFQEIIYRDEDQRKRDITIEHLLTMTPGIDWPEFEEWNCFAPMVYQDDIIKFILERPLVSAPGEKMNYNSGCSHLLSAILQQATGRSAHDFAKEYLFGPLGISSASWHSRHGISLGADGLKLTSKDMIKFGTLYLNKGKMNGNQIISENWILESTTPRYQTYKNIGSYGYHWWCSMYETRGTAISYYFALGFGGQNIFIVPCLNLVAVFTSRMYNDSLRTLHYFNHYILDGMVT